MRKLVETDLYKYLESKGHIYSPVWHNAKTDRPRKTYDNLVLADTSYSSYSSDNPDFSVTNYEKSLDMFNVSLHYDGTSYTDAKMSPTHWALIPAKKPLPWLYVTNDNLDELNQLLGDDIIDCLVLTHNGIVFSSILVEEIHDSLIAGICAIVPPKSKTKGE